MSLKLLHSSSPSTAGFRVACGEMVIDESWYSHPEATVAYVRRGTLTLQIEHERISLKKDDIYFIAPNQKYKIPESNDVSVEVVMLNLSKPSAITQEFIPLSIIRGLTSGNCTHFAKITSECADYDKMAAILDIINEAETEKYKYFQLIVHAKIYELYFYLFSNDYVKIFDVETQSRKYTALRKVTDYIDDNFCDAISLDSVAKETGLSRYYISHLFNELMSTTFVGYISDLRLGRAAILLTTTNTPIIEIAGMSGFNNISNFNRAFKMHHGMTPSAYRKNCKN